MIRVRLAGFAALALIAVSGIAASSASAAFTLKTEECSGGTNIAFCWAETAASPLLELSGEEAIVSNEGEALFTIPNLGVEILCTKTSIEQGTVVQTSPLTTNYSIKKLILEFKGCAIETAGLNTKCRVPVEKLSNLLTGTPSSATTFRVAAEEAGGPIIAFPIEQIEGQVCAPKGEKIVKGFQDVEFTNPGTDELEKTITAVLKSGLTIAGQPTELSLSLKVKPALLGDFWDVVAVA